MPVPTQVTFVLTVVYDKLNLEEPKELIDKANEYGNVTEAKLIVPSLELQLETY